MKKIIAVLVVLSLVLGFGTAFAEEVSLEEKVTVLTNLNVIEDGFLTDGYIKRQEFSEIIINLQNLSGATDTQKETSVFSDVSMENEYLGHINMLNILNVVIGDGDGNFRPNDDILTQEAVKMCVKALGYQDNYINAFGGYPNGYMVIASTQGVTKGLNLKTDEYLTKKDAVVLCYNMLKAPMMVASGYDAETKSTQYVIDKNSTLGKQLGYIAE